MPAHRLRLDKSRSSAEWLLQWDSAILHVTDPTGTLIFEYPVEQAHRIVELHKLDTDGKISFATSAGLLTFKRNKAALRDVRELVMQGLRLDTVYRETQKRKVRVTIPLGLVAFIVCGGLFSLYCWWASWAPDPPKGNWLYSIGWLIHLVLLVLLGVALRGVNSIYISLRQLRRIHQVERSIAEESVA